MFYMGTEFNKETNKPYKTEDGGRKAAEKAMMRLFDDDGKTVADFRPDIQEETPGDAPGEGVTVTMTDNVPDGALEDEDGDVKIYNGSGNAVGTMSRDEAEAAAQECADGDEIRVAGKIRRIFHGLLRVRRIPSWDKSAEAGVTSFTEKKVIGLLTVDGKPMYKTADGYYITGNPELVEYVAE